MDSEMLDLLDRPTPSRCGAAFSSSPRSYKHGTAAMRRATKFRRPCSVSSSSSSKHHHPIIPSSHPNEMYRLPSKHHHPYRMPCLPLSWTSHRSHPPPTRVVANSLASLTSFRFVPASNSISSVSSTSSLGRTTQPSPKLPTSPSSITTRPPTPDPRQ